MTPELTYRGRDADKMYFDATDAEIDITENPTVNRTLHRKGKTQEEALKEFASSQDIACRVIQILSSPNFQLVANINPKGISTGEYNGLLVSKVKIDLLAEVHNT